MGTEKKIAGEGSKRPLDQGAERVLGPDPGPPLHMDLLLRPGPCHLMVQPLMCIKVAARQPCKPGQNGMIGLEREMGLPGVSSPDLPGKVFEILMFCYMENNGPSFQLRMRWIASCTRSPDE